jgi:hypothetical protein
VNFESIIDCLNPSAILGITKERGQNQELNVAMICFSDLVVPVEMKSESEIDKIIEFCENEVWQ